jgi:hypothetical protein
MSAGESAPEIRKRLDWPHDERVGPVDMESLIYDLEENDMELVAMDPLRDYAQERQERSPQPVPSLGVTEPS